MEKMKSRKFIMSLVGGLIVVANDGLNLGLDGDTITQFVGIGVGYLVSQGAVDAMKAK